MVGGVTGMVTTGLATQSDFRDSEIAVSEVDVCRS